MGRRRSEQHGPLPQVRMLDMGKTPHGNRKMSAGKMVMI
jgi:hypothetical protein